MKSEENLLGFPSAVPHVHDGHFADVVDARENVEHAVVPVGCVPLHTKNYY